VALNLEKMEKEISTNHKLLIQKGEKMLLRLNLENNPFVSKYLDTTKNIMKEISAFGAIANSNNELLDKLFRIEDRIGQIKNFDFNTRRLFITMKKVVDTLQKIDFEYKRKFIRQIKKKVKNSIEKIK